MLLIALPRGILMVCLRGRKNVLVSHRFFFFLDQTRKMKVCHVVASEHPVVIEGRRRFIATDYLDSEDGSIDNYGAD